MVCHVGFQSSYSVNTFSKSSLGHLWNTHAPKSQMAKSQIQNIVLTRLEVNVEIATKCEFFSSTQL